MDSINISFVIGIVGFTFGTVSLIYIVISKRGKNDVRERPVKTQSDQIINWLDDIISVRNKSDSNSIDETDSPEAGLEFYINKGSKLINTDEEKQLEELNKSLTLMKNQAKKLKELIKQREAESRGKELASERESKGEKPEKEYC